MLDWLSGDPLSGLGTTLGFFTFAIIGRWLRKRMVEKWRSTSAE